MPFKNPHPLYSAWQGMRRRCLNPNFKQWADYGGRGISICPEWNDFHQFARDMGPKPSPLHSLDRIDNDGDYEPGNCRWATKKEQQRNRRMAVFVTIEGTEYRVAELAEKYRLKADTIVQRAKKGLQFETVVSQNKIVSHRKPVEAVAARVANQRNATHCKHGHFWDEKNTYFTKEGWKRCRECLRIKNLKRAAKERSEARTTTPSARHTARATRKVTIQGIEYVAASLAHQFGIKADTIISRAEKGMSFERATAKTRYNFTGTVRKAIAVRVANQRSKTHCKHGHEFTEENTYWYRGCRTCRECSRLKEARKRMRKRALST